MEASHQEAENKNETSERKSIKVAIENDYKILSGKNAKNLKTDSKHDKEEEVSDEYDGLTMCDETTKAGLKIEEKSRKDNTDLEHDK